LLEKNVIKILLEDDSIKIPSDKLGLDLGQSLFKTAICEKGELVLSIKNTNSGIVEINNFISSHPKRFNKLNFTGGKAFKLYNLYNNTFQAMLINEFEANIKGLNLLYSLQKKKSLPSSIIVTIGTGTSMVLKKENNFSHLGGSALGGGFFMGIAKLLCDMTDYLEAITLANNGNRYNVDLKVADIYDKQDPRVDVLFREFTAASLGKVNNDVESNSINKGDLLCSINATLAENIGTFATIIADNNQIATIVFCGGFLINNKAFKQILSLLCKLKNKKAIFIDYSEFAGALGALIYE
jgi:pantothenate kinase